MADVGTHHFVKSSSSSDRVLVPQPSYDPHDPLVCSWNDLCFFFLRLTILTLTIFWNEELVSLLES